MQLVIVEVSATHKQDACCAFCGGPLRKTRLDEVRWAGEFALRAEHLPGYECRACDDVVVDLDALAEFLQLAVDNVRSTPGARVPSMLTQELALVREHQTQATGMAV